MIEKKESQEGIEVASFTTVGASVGTIVAAIAGTTIAAPAAIGAGLSLVIWGVFEYIKEPRNKKNINL